ncbi:hypothetical protein M9458_040175, partial [Cirrhinus mrigala]
FMPKACMLREDGDSVEGAARFSRHDGCGWDEQQGVGSARLRHQRRPQWSGGTRGLDPQ